MLLLNQNSQNMAYLTLSEAVPNSFTSSTPYFLFRFISFTTNNEILFTAQDISTAITRYNQFVFTLTGSTSQNLTGGTFYMEPAGEWTYEVYPMYSQTNLFLSGTTGTMLEKGIVKLVGTSASTYITQEYSGKSSTYGYYQG